MVYLHIPAQLTDEETMLQKKYQQLRKKKKALQQLKSPKQEPTSIIQAPKRAAPEMKYDAKEVAKKLLKSGAISAIKVETKETQGFKRSKTLERRRNTSDLKAGSNVVAGYQPFSSSHNSDSEDDSVSNSPATKPQVKNLYDSFVTAQEPDDKPEPVRPAREHRERPPLPKQGNTIYCHGFGVTEEVLRKALSPFGNIINVSMELEKNCGFVTFDKMDNAAKAISEMNGATVSNINLRVSLARRQPIIDQGSESNWSTIAASNSQKGSHRDSRDLIAYNENIF